VRNELSETLQKASGTGTDGHPKTEVLAQVSLAELLVARQFNPAIVPPPLRVIYSLAGIPICTPGNLTTITSAVKTGKTAVISAMAGAAMPHSEAADLLGFESSNPEGKALLWFDSEQSPDDFWHCVYRALRRAGHEKPPPWFYAYCLTGLGCKRAWECVVEAEKQAKNKHTGIHSFLLDGVADFVADVNDAEESNDFVAELHGKAIKNDCPIIGVIHLNPGSSEKSRGHLGSQLERKAETNLMLEKDNTDQSTLIYSTKNRRAGIPKSMGPRFKYSIDAGMHVTIASRKSAKEAVEIESLRELAEDVFKDHPSLRYTDLVNALKERLKLSEQTAQRRISRMVALGTITKAAAQLYVMTTPTTSKPDLPSTLKPPSNDPQEGLPTI
jgi:hypothetical protein